MTAIKCFLLDHGYANAPHAPCCHMPGPGNPDIDSFSTLHASKFYIEIKQSMDQGIWHSACEECRAVEAWEDPANQSKRQQTFFRYTRAPMYDLSRPPIYDPNAGLLVLQLSPGFLCNIQCRTCGPGLSSSWIKENQSMPAELAVQNFASNIRYDYSKDDWSKVKVCSFIGGEPLYNPEFYFQLKKLLDEAGDECEIGITTNCTIPLNLEKYEWLSEFKEVHINLSIDGIGQAAEFIRTGTVWDKVVKNINFYKSTKPFNNLSFHLTNSVLNILETDKTLAWLKSMDIPNCGLVTHVTHPKHLSYSVLTDSEKEKIIKQIAGTEAEYIIPALNDYPFDPANRSKFLLLMKHTKQYHGLDWRYCLPDLYNIMNET